MREWQVGDPVGDGNDIGVPDIPYMGYLKDKEEDDYPREEPKSFEEIADRILNRVYVDYSRKDEIIMELKRLLRAKGAVWSDVRLHDIGWVDFVITRENRFFKTL